jgi:hypothetical protein
VKRVVAVKIKSRRYRVKHKSLPKDYGLIWHQPPCIELDENQPDAELADSTLHEIMHGVWNTEKLPKRVTEERAVRILSTGLIAVFRDNPGLLNYLESLIKEAR